MASSEKPDFIEIDQKEAPVELTTGANEDVSTSVAWGDWDPASVPAPEAPLSAPLSSAPVSGSKKAPHPKVNDDVLALQKKSLSPSKSLRKLPGGTFFFIGLLVVVCFWGSRLEEVRNGTLTNLASAFLVEGKGFVETVADLSNSYSQHNNVPAAKHVLDKALSDLSLKGEDKGGKGAFIRLKYALLDFQSNNFNDAKSHAFKALEMLRSGGTYVPYETGFLLYDVAWQFDNKWDYKDGVLFNQKALDIWPKERPNYRGDVVADIGFEYNRLKQFDKAEIKFREALNQSLRHGDSSNNVWRYAQLGHAQVGQKKYMEADINLMSALRMEVRLHKGRKTTHLAQILTDLGRVKAGLGDMKSAQDFLERSANILSKKDESYYYLINQLELANVYRDSGHPEKARPLYGEILRRLNDGEYGPSRKDVRREFDLLLEQTGGKIMAELNVVIPYRSVPLKVVFSSMCALFPMWAVIAPAILGFLIGRAIWYPGILPTHLVVTGCISLVTVMLSCMALSAVSEDNRIYISKDGMCFPPSFLPKLNFKRNRNWNELQAANLVTQTDLPGGNLLLSFVGGEQVNLSLKNIKDADVEQLLLGVELWGANCNRSPELIEYQRSMQNHARGIGQQSYTQMWEDELSRRFAPTTFVPLEPGQKLQSGRIEIVRQLAFGGLSAIYLAQMNKTDMVVLKEAVVHAKADPETKKQAEQHLEREAKILSTLAHPNIARVLDHFVEDERHYLILEYVSGQDLRQFVKQNPDQEIVSVVDWAIEAATILAFLHGNSPSIVHRDLTPDNLVVRNDGSLVLIDFGAANQFVGSATGTVVGKQAYIAPEQLRGKTVPESDLYSLGGTIYYLLTGRDPMPLSISHPKTLRHDTPDALDELVAKLSAFEPQDRISTAEQAVEQLVAIKEALAAGGVVAMGDHI